MCRIIAALMILIAVLIGANPSYGGDPGPEFEALVDIFMRDGQIDREVSRAASELNAGKSNISQAITAWTELLEIAKQQENGLGEIAGNDYPELAKMVGKMVTLQIERINGLLSAAKIEKAQGVQAAKPHWQKQLKSHNAYQALRKKITEKIDYIRANP